MEGWLGLGLGLGCGLRLGTGLCRMAVTRPLITLARAIGHWRRQDQTLGPLTVEG